MNDDATQIFNGKSAEKMLSICLSSAMKENATGGILAYLHQGAEIKTVPWNTEMPLNNVEMIIVDSGNTSGQAWKYVYHVRAKSGFYCDETKLN